MLQTNHIGEAVSVCANGDTLVVSRRYKAEPANGATITVTPPAVVAGGWFSVTNTADNNGTGLVVVTGLSSVTARQTTKWMANTAGTAWVSVAVPAVSGVQTFTGMQRIGVHNQAAWIGNGGAITVNTGIDMTAAQMVIAHFTDGSATRSWSVTIDTENNQMHGIGSPYDTWYVHAHITNRAAGTMNFAAYGVGQTLTKVEALTFGTNGFVVPTATTVRSPITLSANSGAVNVNGATSATLFAGTSARVTVAVPAGQIVSTATTTTTGVTVSIADARTGALEVSIAAGNTGTAAITVGFVTPGASRVVTTADAGVDVTIGTLRFRMSTSGNRSMQVSSNTGASVNITVFACHLSGGVASGTLTMTATTTAAYLVSSWHFGAAGDWQRVVINDTTNSRWYDVTMMVGSGWNTNAFAGFEIL